MLLVGTCVAVGLIIIFMAVGISKNHISMTEVLESHIEKESNVEK
ncbi:hypothetical protein [Gottfriedia sp. OAE603]